MKREAIRLNQVELLDFELRLLKLLSFARERLDEANRAVTRVVRACLSDLDRVITGKEYAFPTLDPNVPHPAFQPAFQKVAVLQ